MVTVTSSLQRSHQKINNPSVRLIRLNQIKSNLTAPILRKIQQK